MRVRVCVSVCVYVQSGKSMFYRTRKSTLEVTQAFALAQHILGCCFKHLTIKFAVA